MNLTFGRVRKITAQESTVEVRNADTGDRIGDLIYRKPYSGCGDAWIGRLDNPGDYEEDPIPVHKRTADSLPLMKRYMRDRMAPH